jgi:hypothetical protein
VKFSKTESTWKVKYRKAMTGKKNDGKGGVALIKPKATIINASMVCLILTNLKI